MLVIDWTIMGPIECNRLVQGHYVRHGDPLQQPAVLSRSLKPLTFYDFHVGSTLWASLFASSSSRQLPRHTNRPNTSSLDLSRTKATAWGYSTHCESRCSIRDTRVIMVLDPWGQRLGAGSKLQCGGLQPLVSEASCSRYT